MMEITLRLSDGQKQTFSEQELIEIVETHLQNKKCIVNQYATEVAEVPTEGKWFIVNPLAIDQNLFKEEREDSRQETTRQYILEAFEEMKKDSKYAKPFKTLMPEKTWKSKTVKQLKWLAVELGDHMADWVEQFLEWAQRIANGESWEDICNKADTANWYRLVVCKDGEVRLVGGSRKCHAFIPASKVGFGNFYDDNYVFYAEPLVVSYDD